jgi:hypothetical protein
MASSLKDAFERARRRAGAATAGEEKKELTFAGQLRQTVVIEPGNAKSGARVLTSSERERERVQTRNRLNVSYDRGMPQTIRTGTQRPVVVPAAAKANAVSLATSRLAHPAKAPPVAPPAPPPAYTVSASKGAVFTLNQRDRDAALLLSRVETAGRATQANAGKFDDEREVVLGLDFGTSCAKVVIGDSALGKAFAVPFCKADGIRQFLLPSRLYQTGRVFSLGTGTHTYRDLKLSLLASPDDPILQQRVVAFLALVIRRARGWFLLEQAATYTRTGIVWKLAVGLPAAQHHQTPLSRLFERLSFVAWTVAGAPTEVTDTAIASLLGEDTVAGTTGDDVEVTVVPEIAAQIYGFVASNSFDKKAPNIYLMADVGSGTVDSSLFHVKQGKGGRWDFEFYTSVVEPNGVSNLHRYRVNWWSEALAKAGAPQELINELAASKLITDQQLSTPESFRDYFDGVQAKFRDPMKTPDEDFFNLRVLSQVQGKTLWRTWKDNLLPQSSLANVPFFMCGGGVRMGYYRELEPRLDDMPGYSWLRAECWVMGVPDDLVADGVAEAEYDRLSVAYGLSRLEVGKVVKALPQPKLAIAPVNIWRDNYVDKDQC